MSRIAQLNDSLRRTFVGGKIFMTRGVAALPESERTAVLEAVRCFDDFSRANDPHGERDFGRVEVAGAEFFFKIDYYAPDMLSGSEDPADPAGTVRVMTIMMASEY